MTGKGRMLILILAAGLTAIAAQVWGQGIKERMRDRLPVINDLKARGVVGENNKGYLEFVKGRSEKPELIAAENADRREVYEAIGRQTGATADVVGRRRALQLSGMARAGEWLQNEAGAWHQK